MGYLGAGALTIGLRTVPPGIVTGVHHADVIVVGGGPAGSAAAITLARAGRHVVLIDKATFPRDKCCGDGLTTGSLRLLEDLGLDPSAVSTWQHVDDVVVVGPTGVSTRLSFPRGRGEFAAVAERRDLDAALLDVARTNGVEVHEGAALTHAETRDDRVVLGVAGLGQLEAPYAIGADGMWSTLRRCLDARLEGYRGDWHAFRQYFSDVSPTAAIELAVWFEADLLPCYAWSFPLPGNRANVGFGILRGSRLSGADMNRTWIDLLQRPHIAEFLGPNAVPEGSHRAWPIPTRLPGPKLSHDRVLFVGDSAAVGDPMTGEGIGQALASGIHAADALLVAGPHDPIVATRRYEAWVRHNLTPDTRMADLLSRALAHRKGVRAAIALADLTPWTRRNFARWLFEDEPRAALLTPHRLHSTFLRRDGAYRT